MRETKLAAGTQELGEKTRKVLGEYECALKNDPWCLANGSPSKTNKGSMFGQQCVHRMDGTSLPI